MKACFDSEQGWRYTVNKISRPGRYGKTNKGKIEKELYERFKIVEKEYLRLESRIARLHFKFRNPRKSY